MIPQVAELGNPLRDQLTRLAGNRKTSEKAMRSHVWKVNQHAEHRGILFLVIVPPEDLARR
jgi:hypothetical protein